MHTHLNTSPLPHHMRIAALQCDFEGGRENTLHVPEFWKGIGFNVEQLFHTHSELYSAVFQKDKHYSLVNEYTEKSRDLGIEIIIYMNCHILLSSQEHNKEEWAQINRDGEYIRSYGTYYACCLNSPWTDFFLESIQGLEDLDIAGIFFDGPSASMCWCSHCKNAFQRQFSIPLVESSKPQRDEFLLQSKTDFIEKVYRTVKEVNPQWLSYINANLLHTHASADQMKKILSCNDIIGTEGGFQFYGTPSDVDIWRAGLHAKLVEAAAEEKRKVIFMAGDHKPWSWYLHTPAETKLCYASILANGSSVWYGIHSNTENLAGETKKAVTEMVQFDKEHEDIYEDSISASDIALFFSYDTSKYYATTGEQTDFYNSGGTDTDMCIGNYSNSFQGAFATLFRGPFPFDIITELNITDLSSYSALVLPTGACLSENILEHIRQFVKKGGILISDSETSLYSADFEKQRDFLLAELLGVSFNKYRKYAPHDYFIINDTYQPVNKKASYIPSPLTAIDITPADGAVTAARLCAHLSGRYADRPGDGQYPFIIENDFHNGKSIYFAGTFFELYRKYGISHYKEIITSIIEQNCEPAAKLINAPESIEITVRSTKNADNLVVHLVNYTGGMNRPITNITPVSGLKLKINKKFTKAKCLKQNIELQPVGNNVIELPELNEFECLVIV